MVVCYQFYYTNINVCYTRVNMVEFCLIQVVVFFKREALIAAVCLCAAAVIDGLALDKYCSRRYLHGADAETPVDDKLAERGGAFVAVSAMDHEQSAQVLKLRDGEICSQRRLLPFLHTQRNKQTAQSTHTQLLDHEQQCFLD